MKLTGKLVLCDIHLMQLVSGSNSRINRGVPVLM